MILILHPISDSEIESLTNNVSGISDFMSSEREDTIDLDKAWWGVHYLISKNGNGDTEPYCYLLNRGTELVSDPEDLNDLFEEVGNIPRALTSQQLKDFERVVSEISDEELKARFDPGDMMTHGVYPAIWDRDDPADLEYLCSYFQTLKEFLRELRKKDLGVLIDLSL